MTDSKVDRFISIFENPMVANIFSYIGDYSYLLLTIVSIQNLKIL